MTKPDRAFAIDLDNASLDDLEELSEAMGSIGENFDAAAIRRVKRVIGLVSNYSEPEVGALTIREFREVMEAIKTGKGGEESSVPLPTGASSPDTPPASPTKSPAGPRSVRSRKSGAARPG